MCSPQDCFHHLASRIPDGMPNANNSYFNWKTAPHLTSDDLLQPRFLHHDESIDELLETYRPTRNSILSCIACLDDSTFTPAQTEYKSPMVQESTFLSTDNIRDPAHSVSKVATVLVTVSACILENKPSNEPSCPHDVTTNRCARRRRGMSIQEKQDRRREQNRAAQRRFREKHMLPSSKTCLEGL
jgi:hypothetical protein